MKSVVRCLGVILLAFVLAPGCKRDNTSNAPSVQQPPAPVTATVATAQPKAKVIGKGTILVSRLFMQQTGTGNDTQKVDGLINFQIIKQPGKQTAEDKKAFGVVDDVTGSGIVIWTEDVKGGNCSWKADAQASAKLEGVFIEKDCQFTIAITEKWKPATYAEVKCPFQLSQILLRDETYFAKFPLVKGYRYWMGGTITNEVWQQKWLTLDNIEMTEDDDSYCFVAEPVEKNKK